MKRKILSAALAVSVAVTGIAGLTACTGGNDKAGGDYKSPAAVNVYAASAVTGASYFTARKDGGSGAHAAAANKFSVATGAGTYRSAYAAQGRPEEVNAVFDDFKTYLSMFENTLSGGGIDVKTTVPEQSDGDAAKRDDGELHAVKTVITVEDVEYVLYYTEKGTVTNKEIDGDETEITENTALYGVLVCGGNVYDVTGGRTVETETEDKNGVTETEREVTVEFTTLSPDGAKVCVKQSTEEENSEKETSYEYKIKDASGKTVSEYELKWEVENSKTEMSVEFTADGAEREFEISVRGENSLKAEYESDDGEKLSFTIDKNADGTYVFRYKNGYSEVVSLVAEPDTEKSQSVNP